MNVHTQTRRISITKQASLTAAAVAVVGLAGGYTLGASGTFTTPLASAHGNNGNHWSDRSRNSGKDVAYIIDAAERYSAMNGMDANLVQATNIVVQDNFALGHLDGGDSGSIFFALKTDGKWSVVYAGQMVTPAAKDSLTKSGFPQSWIDAPSNVKTDDQD